MKETIIDIIKPETESEHLIISNPDFIDGVLWGEPRRGHPEGNVIHHIGDVLENVELFSDTKNREKLRLIAILHDSFKSQVDKKLPRYGANHHATIARRFAEQYITDIEILEIIELHDEAYNAWCVGDRSGNWGKAEGRALQLIQRLGSSLELYIQFYKCDNTSGKDSVSLTWFLELVNDVKKLK